LMYLQEHELPFQEIHDLPGIGVNAISTV